MSKINSITLSILSVLAASSVWAEEDTIDTHFMIGGLNGEKISRYQIDGDKEYDQSLYKPDRLLVSEYQNDASQTMPQNHQP